LSLINKGLVTRQLTKCTGDNQGGTQGKLLKICELFLQPPSSYAPQQPLSSSITASSCRNHNPNPSHRHRGVEELEGFVLDVVRMNDETSARSSPRSAFYPTLPCCAMFSDGQACGEWHISCRSDQVRWQHNGGEKVKPTNPADRMAGYIRRIR